MALGALIFNFVCIVETLAVPLDGIDCAHPHDDVQLLQVVAKFVEKQAFSANSENAASERHVDFGRTKLPGGSSSVADVDDARFDPVILFGVGASRATGDNATIERQVEIGRTKLPRSLSSASDVSDVRVGAGLAQQQSRCLAACAIYAICAFYYQVRPWISIPTDPNDDTREHGWDLAKLWFILCVLLNHSPWAGAWRNDIIWINLCLRSEMSGFSFISGIFSASFEVYEHVEEEGRGGS